MLIPTEIIDFLEQSHIVASRIKAATTEADRLYEAMRLPDNKTG